MKKRTDKGKDMVPIIAFDTEWQNLDDGKRKILSYQYFSLLPDGRSFSRVCFNDGDKIPLGEFIHNIMVDGKEKGFFANYPKTIVLVAHYNVADLTAFSDFHRFKDKFDVVRASFSTLRESVPFKIQIKGNYHRFNIILRDTINLAPQGMAKLEDLGKIIGIEKICLENHGHSVTDMERLLIENPTLFESYSSNDAEITAKYCEKIMQCAIEHAHKTSVPISLASVSVNIFCAYLDKIGVDRLKLMGKEVVGNKINSGRKYYKKNKEVLIPVLNDNLAIANESYFGGRNESYFYGPCKIDNWLDVDLKGAYTTTMATIGFPLYGELSRSKCIDDYQLGVLGYARLKWFRFPVNTAFPNIPQRYDGGIQFVLEGENTYATANDIWLAKKLGAEMEIEDGIIIPCDMSQKPFLKFVQFVNEKRKMAKQSGNKFDNQFWKEIGNSLYGKIAQGRPLGNKFDSRKEKTEGCKISNVFLAAYITSLTRVCIGEQLDYIHSEGYQILSVTTDGYITNFPENRLPEIINLNSSKLYSHARAEISGNPEIIEIKKRAKQVLSIKKRGQIELDFRLNLEDELEMDIVNSKDEDSSDTSHAVDNSITDEFILSKAGIKPPRGLKSKVAIRDWFVGKHLQRVYKSKIERSTLTSAIYMRKHDNEDFHELKEDFVFDTDYDMSRKPFDVAKAKLNDIEHIIFKTMPYTSIKEFLNYRDKWKQFAARYEITMMDMNAVKLFLKAMQHDQNELDYHSCDCQFDFKKFKIQILRAYMNDELGFTRNKSDLEFVNFLTSKGYDTTIDNLHYAKNQVRMALRIYQNKDHFDFINVIKEYEPSINYSQLMEIMV